MPAIITFLSIVGILALAAGNPALGWFLLFLVYAMLSQPKTVSGKR